MSPRREPRGEPRREPRRDQHLNVIVSRFLSRGVQKKALDVKFEHSFLKMLEQGLHADLTLVASGGGTVKAHRCVLATVSPVFHGMFRNDLKEQVNSRVELPRMRIQVLQLLLILVYLMPSLNDDDASLPEFDEVIDEYFMEIFEAWHMYQFGGRLASVIASALPRNITPSNCWWIYDRIASFPNKAPGELRMPLANDKSPLAVCMRYILDNLDVISGSQIFILEMQRNPELVRDFIILSLVRSRN